MSVMPRTDPLASAFEALHPLAYVTIAVLALALVWVMSSPTPASTLCWEGTTRVNC